MTVLATIENSMLFILAVFGIGFLSSIFSSSCIHFLIGYLYIGLTFIPDEGNKGTIPTDDFNP